MLEDQGAGTPRSAQCTFPQMTSFIGVTESQGRVILIGHCSAQLQMRIDEELEVVAERVGHIHYEEQC